MIDVPSEEPSVPLEEPATQPPLAEPRFVPEPKPTDTPVPTPSTRETVKPATEKPVVKPSEVTQPPSAQPSVVDAPKAAPKPTEAAESPSQPSPPPSAQAEKPAEATPSPESAPDEAAPAEKKKTPINLDELASRIVGNNVALRRLAAELDEKKTWDAGQLAPVVAALEPLVGRKDDLTLFRETLSAEEQTRVGELESPAAVIANLGGKIAAARKRAQDKSFPGTAAQRQTELEMLDALSRKLADMVFSDH